LKSFTVPGILQFLVFGNVYEFTVKKGRTCMAGAGWKRFMQENGLVDVFFHGSDKFVSMPREVCRKKRAEFEL
jgi:hypothetical protein